MSMSQAMPQDQASPEILQTLSQAPDLLHQNLPLQFHRVSDYTTFFCEYVFKEEPIFTSSERKCPRRPTTSRERSPRPSTP